MLSHLMETLLLVLIASSRNVESSTGSGIVAGNNGKEIFANRRQNVNHNRKVGAKESRSRSRIICN